MLELEHTLTFIEKCQRSDATLRYVLNLHLTDDLKKVEFEEEELNYEEDIDDKKQMSEDFGCENDDDESSSNDDNEDETENTNNELNNDCDDHNYAHSEDKTDIKVLEKKKAVGSNLRNKGEHISISFRIKFNEFSTGRR